MRAKTVRSFVVLIALELILFYSYSYLFLLDRRSVLENSTCLNIAAWLLIGAALTLPILFCIYLARAKR